MKAGEAGTRKKPGLEPRLRVKELGHWPKGTREPQRALSKECHSQTCVLARNLWLERRAQRGRGRTAKGPGTAQSPDLKQEGDSAQEMDGQTEA